MIQSKEFEEILNTLEKRFNRLIFNDLTRLEPDRAFSTLTKIRPLLIKKINWNALFMFADISVSSALVF